MWELKWAGCDTKLGNQGGGWRLRGKWGCCLNCSGGSRAAAELYVTWHIYAAADFFTFSSSPPQKVKTFTKPAMDIMTPNATASVHTGPASIIPQDSSPGLLFLSIFLPALDSLSLSLPINSFLHPDCQIITNGGDPIGPEQLGKMFVMRAGKLERFEHELVRSWDISGIGARHTVGFPLWFSRQCCDLNLPCWGHVRICQ